MTINLYPYFQALRERQERIDRNYGKLPWWWYPCAAFAGAIPLFLIFTILFL